MNRKTLSLILLLLSVPVISRAQEQEYKDPAGKFKLSLVGEWRAISYSDAVGRTKIEFVYGDRSEGLLKITKERLNGESLAGKVQAEEDNFKFYRAGFERSTKERFDAGSLDGLRFAFFTTDSGRKTASAFYYLQDGDALWILRFTGKRGVLDTIRNVTDRMVRSFTPLEK